MPKKEALLSHVFWAAVIGGCVFLGISRQGKAEKITFERLSDPPIGEAAPAKPAVIQVHVTGAVRKPGVYTLKPDSRIHDAIREAGGAKANARLDEWNLAARVSDGANLHINSKGAASKPPSKVASRSPQPARSIEIAPLRIEVPDEYRAGPNAFAPTGKISLEPEKAVPPRSSGGKKALPAEGSINLNTASIIELQRLPGVGPSTAQKILDYRHEHGGFASIDEMLAVKGIGPKKLDAMRKYVRL